MNGRDRVYRALIGLTLAGILVAIGAAGAIVVLRHKGESVPALAAPSAVAAQSASREAGPSASDPTADTEVVVSSETLSKIEIRTATIGLAEGRTLLEIPGIVMANAYREVKVTPIAPGIVTKVHVELGSVVRRGDPLATLFSAELADVQTKYLAMAAMLEAESRKLHRVSELVRIGAASRQELEEVTAIQEVRATELEAARQRLLLLGLSAGQVLALKSPTQVVSDVIVPAPIDGVITARSANLGQVVGMGQEVMVVTDLSQVWVVGDLFEQDFKSVAVGSEAALSTPAYPGFAQPGRVSYIDPRVDPQTRTAKLRVEIPNPTGRLRLGMYVTLGFEVGTGGRRPVVPRAAVQTLGERQIVFLPVKDDEGKFIQRTVRLGEALGDAGYAVLRGLSPGDVVVTSGSFFLRAEAVRNGPSG
jgi:RND family efflux transporter MFP subunit